MIGKLDDYLRFNETALNLRGQRQQLIASNIANADTPNYKSRDIDFNSAMKTAMTRTNPQATQLAATTSMHLSAKPINGSSGVNGLTCSYPRTH